MTQRFEQAQELFGFARQLRDIRFRGTERYLEDRDELARAMEARGEELLRADEPRPDTVFRSGRGHAAGGRPFRSETKSRRASAAA